MSILQGHLHVHTGTDWCWREQRLPPHAPTFWGLLSARSERALGVINVRDNKSYLITLLSHLRWRNIMTVFWLLGSWEEESCGRRDPDQKTGDLVSSTVFLFWSNHFSGIRSFNSFYQKKYQFERLCLVYSSQVKELFFQGQSSRTPPLVQAAQDLL